MTKRVTEAGRETGEALGLPPSFHASRGIAAQRSRVCTPLTKYEEKERLLAVRLAVYTQTTQTRVVPLTGRTTWKIRFNQDTTQI